MAVTRVEFGRGYHRGAEREWHRRRSATIGGHETESAVRGGGIRRSKDREVRVEFDYPRVVSVGECQIHDALIRRMVRVDCERRSTSVNEVFATSSEALAVRERCRGVGQLRECHFASPCAAIEYIASSIIVGCLVVRRVFESGASLVSLPLHLSCPGEVSRHVTAYAVVHDAARAKELQMDLELTGKRALVTGGSRGIGKAIAMQLAEEGVDVAIAARDEARIAQTVAEISAATGRKIFGATLDASDGASIAAMVKSSADALGGIDILVNGAARPGGQAPAPRWDAVTEEALFEELQVKVLGYLRVAQAAAPYMIANGWGRIINISGLAARQSGSVIGSVRNVAVAAMSKNLADELAPHGINVVTVHPGTTVTEATSAEAAARPAANLVGRMIDASEVAHVIVFLCSPKSVAIDGDTIAAGGGVPRAIYY